MNGPNFLCIGAHKAGTTWLQKVLETHPDVFLPMKEIHFFDRDPSYPSSNYLAAPSPFTRLMKKKNRTRNIKIARALAKSILTVNTERFRFFSNFFLTVNDQWYPNLFATKRKYKVKGDITPAYSILREEDVQKIRDMNPGMKIIFIMRNPIYRDWSAARYNITEHGHNVNSIKYFDRDEMILRGDYLRTIEHYSKFFPTDQILYCFFEELVETPHEFYNRLCRFLGIAPCAGTFITKQINKSPIQLFNPTIRLYLASRHLAQLKNLADRFGGYCEGWYQEAKKIIEQGVVERQNILFPKVDQNQ
ncbi:sulfotransferase [Desulfosudis oleivorans]|nr:sulfotransferase [Desulfosudis oleivorans]